MPTYEFRCPDGTIIERVFKISEVPSEIPSPNGDGMATRMISGGAALLFKGSGFYITDYGKDGKKDQRAAAGEKSGGSSGGESAGSSGAAPSSGPAPSSSSSATPKSD
jgi:predicted nucleic acid-binding Zn ribbon protein